MAVFGVHLIVADIAKIVLAADQEHRGVGAELPDFGVPDQATVAQ